jgi:hypothetical protein
MDHLRRLEGIYHILERKSKLDARVRLVGASSGEPNEVSFLSDLGQLLPANVRDSVGNKCRYIKDNTSLLYIKIIVDTVHTLIN